MAKKTYWDVVFLIVLGVVLMFVTFGIPDELIPFGLAFVRAVN